MKKVSIFGAAFIASLSVITPSSYPVQVSPYNAIEPCHHDGSKPVAVIFDLGNVLLETKRGAALWQLGPRQVFSYLLRHRSIGKMKKQLYTTLNRIDNSAGNPYGAKDPDGTLLPNIFASWLRGEQSNRYLLAKVKREIQEHPEWFGSPQEQQLIESIAQLTFDPVRLIKTCRPIEEMVAFAQECKQKNYRLYVLSNWDAESFQLLAQKYKNLFALFDDIIISGHVHKMKPEADMFSFITDKVPAHQCIFIDDQSENVDAARKAGMHAILTTPRRSIISKVPDIQKLREEFAQQEQLTRCTD